MLLHCLLSYAHTAKTHGITYSKRQLELFNKWDNQDPISAKERAHNLRVIKVTILVSLHFIMPFKPISKVG